MKTLKFVTILIIITGLSLLVGCGSTQEINNGSSESAEASVKNNITSLQVEPYALDTFVVRYSNIIYEHEGKKLKFPIFQGTLGDVLYTDFLSYCWKSKFMPINDVENGFIIKCREGEIKKTILEFIAFYKSNILKDVDLEKPLVEPISGRYGVWYDFKMHGVPCSIRITYIGSFNYDKGESIYSILPNEKSDPSFEYRFYVGIEPFED